MKKATKMITTSIVLILVLVVLDKFSTHSNTSLYLPQNGQKLDFISKVQDHSHKSKYL
jgi:hypothetical protein